VGERSHPGYLGRGLLSRNYLGIVHESISTTQGCVLVNISVCCGASKPNGNKPRNDSRCGQHFLYGIALHLSRTQNRIALTAIVFHYVHDIFVLLVQNTPGADETLASALLYAFLWIALLIGAVLTKYIVERWPTKGSKTLAVQA
jgi:hypothetical protein